MKMNITATIAAIWTAIAAITIGPAAPAHADKGLRFQTPSGNISCSVSADSSDRGVAVCDIGDRAWATPSNCGPGMSERFSIAQGDSRMFCFNGPLLVAGVGTLDYGQTQFFSGITCDSEPDPAGVTCTDTTTGHFFRVSRESYDLG
jgi:hypothetical protein